MKFEDNPLFTEPQFEVTVDAWENQRYKPLQGGWQAPWQSEQMQVFSDLRGEIAIPFERSSLEPIVNPPLGWKWVSDKWMVDKSQAFGSTDNDGWSYASSFDSLVENSVKKKLEGEMGRLSLVRRRRWVRKRVCITSDAKREFEYRLTWLKELRRRLETVVAEKVALAARVVEYEGKRKKLFDTVFESAESSLQESAMALDAIAGKLQQIRQFLVERGNVEREYARKLKQLGDRWIRAGQTPSEVEAGDSHNNSGSNKKPGFFFLVSAASQKISDLFEEFSGILVTKLPADVEEIVVELLAVRSEFSKEAPKLKNVLKLREDALGKQILAYRTTFELSQDRDNTKIVELSSSFFEVSAAVSVLEEARYTSSTGSTQLTSNSTNDKNSSSVTGDGAGTANSTPNSLASQSAYKGIDVWLAVQRYKRAVVDADSSLFVYNGFAIQQRRATHQASTKVAALLQSLIRVFSVEHSTALDRAHTVARSILPGTIVPTVRISGGENSDVVVISQEDRAREPKPRENTLTLLEINLSENAAVVAPPSPLRKFEDGEEVDEAEIEKEILGIQSGFPEPPPMPAGPPIAFSGKLQFGQYNSKSSSAGSLTSSAVRMMKRDSKTSTGGASLPASTTSAASADVLTVASSRENVVWKDVGAVVTFDMMLHIFLPHDFPFDQKKIDSWVSGADPLLSIDLTTVEIEPCLMPVAGARDVFELRTRLSSFSLGILKSQSSPSMIVPTILLQTRSPDENRTWMRILTNPVADPTMDPPEAQLANSEIERQKEILLSSITIPPKSVDAIDC